MQRRGEATYTLIWEPTTCAGRICTRAGKFKSTTCPESRHHAYWAAGACGKLPADTDDDRGGHATALVVGGNSGSDCVGWQRLLSGDANFSLANWQAVVRSHTGGRKYPMPVCGPRGLREYPLAAASRPARTVTHTLLTHPLANQCAYSYTEGLAESGLWRACTSSCVRCALFLLCRSCLSPGVRRAVARQLRNARSGRRRQLLASEQLGHGASGCLGLGPCIVVVLGASFSCAPARTQYSRV